MRGLLVAAAFAAGLALGFAIWNEGGAGGRASRVVTQEAAAGRAPEAPALGEALASIEADPVATGGGTIQGRVVDGDGAPVSDVLIVADPRRPYAVRKIPKGLAAPDEADLAEEVRKFVARRRGEIASRRTARTDRDGHYVLTGLPDAQHFVQAYRAGYDVRPQSGGPAYRVEPGSTIDFVASAIVRLDLRVELSDGSVPESVGIGVQRRVEHGGWMGGGDAWTADEPWLDLAPGEYRLNAYLPTDPQTRSEDVQLAIVPGTKPEPVTLTIKVLSKLRVLVRMPEGFGRAPARIRAMRFAGERVPDAGALQNAPDLPRDYGSDPRVAEFVNLEPGRYLVGAGWSHRSEPVVMQTVEVAGSGEVTLTMPALDLGSYSRVRVLDPDGNDLADVQFVEEVRSARSRSATSVTAIPRDDGVYFVGREKDEAADEHWLYATHARFGSARTAIDAGSLQILTIRFEKPAYADVRIEGYGASEYQGRLQISLQSAARCPATVGFQSPGGDGSVRLGPVQPGEFEIVMCVAASQFGSPEIARTPVTLRSGANAVPIPIPALHDFKVIWKGEGKPKLGLRKSDRRSHDSFRAEVGDDGVARFRGLPPGEYELVYYSRVTTREKRPVVRIPEMTELAFP